MIKIQIDGKYYEVVPGKNLLETCLALGLDIPHFCYHGALGSVGACRLCAVKKFRNADDQKGKIIMSCMEPVLDGLIISIEDKDAKEFRAAVIEGLMTNHPHDCPVCDEGGECHLQDMTVMTGHNYRRFDFKKRTYQNQNLGPFIQHEMNRCIQCYRCVRFYRDYAGGTDLNAFSSRNTVYFGRQEDGTLENEFSGNLVEVCPTGVFTDKTLMKHYTRKWDLSNAPSVCVHCSLGCNTIASERYDSLRRIMSRYNGDVNGYFICDRGRFGYEFVNDEKRVRNAEVRTIKEQPGEEVTDETLYSKLKDSFTTGKKLVGIGSPRASLESNYALSVLVGKDNFYSGISKKEQQLTKTILDFLQQSGIETPSLKQIEKADAIFILGEDLVNTAPMMALAVREASRNLGKEMAGKLGIPSWNADPVMQVTQEYKIPIFIATPFKDSLDELAENTFRANYPDIGELGFAVAAALSKDAPQVKLKNKELQILAEKIASNLKNAKNPIIISGINCGDEAVIRAACNIATALHSTDNKGTLSMILPESNSMGLAFLAGKSLDEAVSLAEKEDIDTLVLLENDLYRRATEESVSQLFKHSKQTIVLDQLTNATTSKADILIPAATFAESEGTLVNNEGRAQRFYKTIVNKDQVKESWRWLAELLRIKNNTETVQWKKFDDIVSDMLADIPAFSKLKEYFSDADFRMLNEKIPRQSMRYSGRTSIHAKTAVSETGIQQDIDSPLSFSMEGNSINPPASLTPFYWAPGWNSVQAVNKYLDEPNGKMKDGNSGIRLIEIVKDPENLYFNYKVQSVEFKKGEWQIVPVYQIFGSEELSSAAVTLAQRIPEPFVYLNPKDAEDLKVKNEEMIQLEISTLRLSIKVKIEESIGQGMAGLTVGLPGLPFIDLPENGKIYK
ncbi:MAG: NADH-quinone oxidoreductase subunit NuoG [Paludibacter sp.]|nr:NADH-quinone oxidoreductase subunit NuoG [Paludibacter sp.]